jgi:hypothetical protein
VIIRKDHIAKTELDKFVSASGLWLSVLTEQFEGRNGNLKVYYLVNCTADTKRVRQIKRLGPDPVYALGAWESWKAMFAHADPTKNYEDNAPVALTEMRYKPPYLTQEDLKVALKMKPVNGKIYVRDLVPLDEVTARAQAVGLTAIVSEENKPRATMGVVLKLDEKDAFINEKYKVNDIVMFSRHAGNTFQEGEVVVDKTSGRKKVIPQEYRSLEDHEIIGVRDPTDGLEDLTLEIYSGD